MLNHPVHTYDAYYSPPLKLPPRQKQRSPKLDIVNLLCENETETPSLSVTSSPSTSGLPSPTASSIASPSTSSYPSPSPPPTHFHSSIASSFLPLHQPYHPTPYPQHITHHQYQHRLFLMMDEEGDPHSDSEDDDHHHRIKSKRRRASNKQLQVLNRVFQHTFFPSTQVRAQLGRQLGMSPRTVQIWFQNRRQAIRTKERRNTQS
ncbi:hypothetical protein [Absidia glauca]|uniref:Homeobox domain-containing protein n=1 Tax=Absidia glauca TaxID=4829 RepID=A0A168M1U1_ABSGL|nr:hypothetical protein [Absidia glauca]